MTHHPSGGTCTGPTVPIMIPARRSGVTLVAAAVVIVLLASPLLLGAVGSGAGFFSVPLLSGLGFLAAATFGGRQSPLWGTGLTVTVWGLLVLLHFQQILLPGAPSRIVYSASVLVGLVVALLLLRVVPLRNSWAGALAAAALSLGLYIAALAGVPVVDQWWLYAAILAARGGYELLRPARTHLGATQR